MLYFVTLNIQNIPSHSQQLLYIVLNAEDQQKCKIEFLTQAVFEGSMLHISKWQCKFYFALENHWHWLGIKYKGIESQWRRQY